MENLISTSLLRQIPVPVLLLNRELQIIEYSESFTSGFNLSAANIEGKRLSQVLDNLPEDLENLLSQLLDQGNPDSFEGHYTGSVPNDMNLRWRANPVQLENDTEKYLLLYLNSVQATKVETDLTMRFQELASIGGWKLHLESEDLSWTEVTKQIHEVEPGYEPDLQTALEFYKEGEDRAKITELVERAIDLGIGYDTELKIVTAKGNEKWVRARGEADMENGKCVRLYGTFEDITEQQQGKLQFQQVSERLMVATSVSRIGIWEYDLRNQEVYWDEMTRKLYEYPEGSEMSYTEWWNEVVHEEDREYSKKIIESSLSDKSTLDFEIRVYPPDQQPKYLKVKGLVQKDEEGNIVRIIGTNLDITELKNTQLRLQRSEESFTGAFERSATGMALVGKNGKWIEVNQSLCNSLGYTREELLVQTFQDITHPDDLNKDLSLLNELLEGKRNSYQIEKRYYHREGHLVFVILTVTAVKDVHGNLTHFISQVLDISQRIEAEKRLRSLVNVTKEQNSSLLNFAHIVSHNLRSHSTNMSMLTNFLDIEEDAQERRNIVAMLKNASDGLNDTVQHLNEVVQVKTGALEKMRSLNLLHNVNSVVQNVNAQLKDINATVNIKIPRAHFVEAVPAYLDSIILNLFTNAIKYRSHDRDLELNVRSQKRKGSIILKVQDNGAGIDMERHGDKIFGMYKTFHHHPEARGIGLFITKNQVEAMNGKIIADSTPGKGTTFTIYFKEG